MPCLRVGVAFFVVLLLAGSLTRPALSDDVIVPEEIPVHAPAAPVPAPGEPTPLPEPPVADPAPNPVNPLTYKLGTFVWLPDIGGTFRIEGASVAIDYDLSHGDVLDLVFNDLAGILPFFGEVAGKRFRMRFDLYWLEFKRVGLADLNLSVPDLPLERQSQLALDMHIHLLWFNTALSYRLFEKEFDVGPLDYLRIEPMIGLRYVYFSDKAVIKDSTIPELIGATALDVKENWWTLLPVGLEVELGFCDKWSLLANATIGGWGIGNAGKGTDGTGDLLLNYRFLESGTLQAGLRWYDMNMKGDEVDDTIDNAYGPLVRVTWSF